MENLGFARYTARPPIVIRLLSCFSPKSLRETALTRSVKYGQINTGLLKVWT